MIRAGDKSFLILSSSSRGINRFAAINLYCRIYFFLPLIEWKWKMPTEGVQLLALEKKKGLSYVPWVVLSRYWWLAKILTKTKTEACLVLQKVDLMVAKCSCKCFLRLRPVFILRAETLSDPLWIKKRTILIVTGMKTSVLAWFGLGNAAVKRGKCCHCPSGARKPRCTEVSCSLHKLGTDLRPCDAQTSAP